MSRARAAIFARLRAAELPAPVPAPDLAAHYHAQAGAQKTPHERTGLFIAQARAWKAEVIETDEAGWPAALSDVCERKNLQRVLAGPGTAIAGQLATALPGRLHWYTQDLGPFKQELFAGFDAGITTVRSGIAETGSLILWPTPQEPRTLSLVPPVHIAVFRASLLHERFYDALRAERWADGMPSNALLVSGPSKTADIQRILAYGAHGPKELVILLVRDDAGENAHAA